MMASLTTHLDYLNAVRSAARRRLLYYPKAIFDVLVSRFYYGLGPRLYSLFNLAQVPRNQWDNYLVDERLRLVLRAINKPAEREIVNDKLAFHDHCVAYALPTISVVTAIQGNSGKYPISPVTASSVEDWCQRLTAAPDRLFVKLIDGTWGMDAFVAERKGDNWHYAGNTGSAAEFYDFLYQRTGSRRGWLLQPLIVAHSALKPVVSSRGLPTIRANTCLLDGVPRLLFAALRIPVGNNVTDNFAHGASGNIIAPVDLTTGRLGKCRGSANTNWPEIVEVREHPDTGNQIEGVVIPMWQQVLTLLEQGQKSLPGLRTLGWDIAVTDDGPLIVETNATYDVDLIQVAHQRGVRPQLEDAFSAWAVKTDAPGR